MDTLQTPIGDIARERPASTTVFLRHKLDFCCGGKRTLLEACTRAGLDAAQIVRELDDAERGIAPEAWERRSTPDLIDIIVGKFHEELRRDVPPLLEAARKVERVHADKPSVPTGLAAELAAFWGEMERHMMKEERVLFPMLRHGVNGARVEAPVRVMEHEHDEHAVRLRRIRELTNDLQPPPEACATWRALYGGLVRIEADLMLHIHLENNVLFPRAS